MRKFLITTMLILVVASSFAQRRVVIESLQKFGKVINAIDNYYIDTVGVDKLSEQAIIAMLKNLDPHSTYISKKDFQAANEALAGSFEGIGVEFTILEDTLTIVSPISGGPSEKVGIESSDKIVAVDDENIAGVNITNDKIFKLLRGKKGTKVNLDIVRKGTKEILKFEVIRDKIPINSVDAAYEVRPGLAYIKLGRFAATSMKEIYDAFANFQNTPQALILDLRGNGGGIMGTAISLADQFLDANKMIVYTSGAHVPSRSEFSSAAGVFKTGKLVILVNESSASASEIVSGAVQDWDRGIIVGRRTYGKGLVQQQLPLGDGSYIRLTISRYHTPTGRVIQRPYENGNVEKYIKDYYDRYVNGEVYNQDSIHFPDSLKYATLSTGRTVYGGGGIMPDIFVPQDTSFYSPYYAKISRRGILNRFALNYVSNNRKKFNKQYPTFVDFNANFTVDNSFVDELAKFAEKEGVERNDAELNKSKEEIKTLIKAMCARDLWSTTEYFKVINSKLDKEFAKAVEVIDDWSKYEKTILKK